MKSFLVLAVYLTSVFAAPTPPPAPPSAFRIPTSGNVWDFRSTMFGDFEANLRKMREEFDQLEKSLGSGFNFGNTDETGVRIFSNGTDIFSLDPTKVKNESRSDTKIVDDKVVHTEEKVIANGNSVVHFKKVEITPKGGSVPSFFDKPKKPFGAPTTSSSIPPEISSTVGSSKNDLDSEQVDNDEKTKSIEESIFGERGISGRPRDVEEIESVSSSRSTSTGTRPTSQKSQKQIYVV